MTERPDYRIYDEPPSEDYIPGYAIVSYVTVSLTKFRDNRELAHNPEYNTYAYIPTEYTAPETSKVPYAVCYFVYKDYFEFLLARRIAKQKRLIFQEPPVNPVYFHKGWVRKEYDPTLYDDDAKKYKEIIAHGMFNLFNKRDLLRMKKAYVKATYKCYAPSKEKGKSCKNDCYDSDKSCRSCPFSKCFGRYKGTHFSKGKKRGMI